MRQINAEKSAALLNFNSRTPRGMRPSHCLRPVNTGKFQLTHPTRDATDSDGGDGGNGSISTHAPHAGCDPGLKKINWNYTPFQLTHPTRDATPFIAHPAFAEQYFNSRTPRGMRRRRGTMWTNLKNFNSRTPRGMRLIANVRSKHNSDFNSRTPRGMRR